MFLVHGHGTPPLVVFVGVGFVLYPYIWGKALQAVFGGFRCLLLLWAVHVGPLWAVGGQVTEMIRVQFLSWSAFFLQEFAYSTCLVGLPSEV